MKHVSQVGTGWKELAIKKKKKRDWTEYIFLPDDPELVVVLSLQVHDWMYETLQTHFSYTYEKI